MNYNIAIYTLIDPITNTIRYIGKTNNPYLRIYSHLSDARRKKSSRYVLRWIRTLLNKNLTPILRVIEWCSEEDWEDREIFWIKHYKEIYPKLCNHSQGGKGVKGKGSRTYLKIQDKPFINKFSKRNRRLTDEEIKVLWNIIRNNSVKDSIIIDSRINRYNHSDALAGRIWSDITGLIKPKRLTRNQRYSILSKIKRQEVWDLYQTGNYIHVQLGQMYNVSRAQIQRIVSKPREI